MPARRNRRLRSGRAQDVMTKPGIVDDPAALTTKHRTDLAEAPRQRFAWSPPVVICCRLAPIVGRHALQHCSRLAIAPVLISVIACSAGAPGTQASPGGMDSTSSDGPLGSATTNNPNGDDDDTARCLAAKKLCGRASRMGCP